MAHQCVVGRQQALTDFHAGNGVWTDRDLYLFSLDRHGVYLVHAARPEMVGQNAAVRGWPRFSEVPTLEGNLGVEVGDAAAPVHILTPSATVRRIVNMTALTVADANASR